MTGHPLGPVIGDVVDRTPIGGGSICQAFRLRTARGVFFAKTLPRADPHMFDAEAYGLRALAAAVPGLVPTVIHVDRQWLVLEWVEESGPSRAAAELLGHRLADLHRTPARAFGIGHPHGRIGSLPMPAGECASWPQMYARLRLEPLLDPGLPRTRRLVDVLREEPDWAGPPQPPSLLHGDLWSGNVLWSAAPVLVDPAAHTGHRETDLAMLALFGTPHLDTVLHAYDESHPLAEGWRDRVGLHQMWPLLVHHRLFGGGYGARAEAIAEGYLRR